MLLSFAAAILAIVSPFSPNFGKNVQFTHAGEIKVSYYPSGFGLSEEASSIRRNSITAISAVSLEPIWHLLHPLSRREGPMPPVASRLLSTLKHREVFPLEVGNSN